MHGVRYRRTSKGALTHVAGAEHRRGDDGQRKGQAREQAVPVPVTRSVILRLMRVLGGRCGQQRLKKKKKPRGGGC